MNLICKQKMQATHLDISLLALNFFLLNTRRLAESFYCNIQSLKYDLIIAALESILAQIVQQMMDILECHVKGLSHARVSTIILDLFRKYQDSPPCIYLNFFVLKVFLYKHSIFHPKIAKL